MPRKQFVNNNCDKALSRRKQIKSYTAKKKVKAKLRQRKKNEKPVNLGWIKKLSQECTTLDEQISLILNAISAPSKYYDDVQTIIEDLTAVMEGNWHESPIRVLAFGSSVTKLALKESDVDLFIDFKGKIPENAQKILINIIKRNKLFERVIEIKARVPILQCKHVNNRHVIFCDISFTDSTGVYVSPLIQAILQLDSRLKALFMMMKYLIKKSPLIPNQEISSFKVIILCIYYCQQVKEPILPPICVLERLATKRETINGWNLSLSWTDLASSLPPVTNRMTVPELLTGFFKFYSQFDFGLRVISPYMGKSYTKSEFSRIDLLPDEYTCYREKLKENVDFRLKVDTAFCVQDPVVHGHNIMRNVSLNTRLKFQRFCRDNYEILNGTNRDFGVAFANLVSRVFSPENETCKNEKNVIHVGTSSDLHTWSIFAEEGLRSHWYEHVCDKLMSILRRVFRFEVRLEETRTERASDKYIVGKTGPFGLIGPLRNEVQSQLDFPGKMDSITRQQLITDYLLDTSLRGIQDSPLSIEIEVPEFGRSLEVLKAFENIMPLLQSVV